MNAKSLTILIILAAALGLGAFVSSTRRAPTPTPAALKRPLIDGLTAKLDSVSRIEVKSGDKVLTLQRRDQGGSPAWVIASKSDFPVEFARVRDALVKFSDLKVVEEKTSKPDLYPRLGVEDVTAPGSKSTLVTLADSAGATAASVILGNKTNAPADPMTPSRDKDGVFARLAGQAQALKVEGAATFDVDPMQWINRTILELERNRVHTVVITPVGAENDRTRILRLTRDKESTPDFVVEDMPPGRELRHSQAAGQPGGALSFVRIDDWKPVAEINFSAPAENVPAQAGAAPNEPPFAPVSAVYTTFDGLTITARVTHRDGKFWGHFTATAGDPTPGLPAEPPPGAAKRRTPDEVRKEAQDLGARFAPWAFALPDYTARQIASQLESLLKEAPKAVDVNPIIGPLPPGPTVPPATPTPEAPAPLAPGQDEPGQDNPGQDDPAEPEDPFRSPPPR
jgi:hypothetical protein